MNGDWTDLDWNQDVLDDVEPVQYNDVVVYSRDWTVDTIHNQIGQSNIDLNPKFQRRNAWNDLRRSQLVESLILGVPIPEIVLAEDPKRKRSYMVIDGKQRLLTISGFMNPEIDYWREPILRGLKARPDLNGLTFKEIAEGPDGREFANASIRCTVISSFKDENVLYDIFYRLNTGSVSLSTQELRQVLNRGGFADFLVESTNVPLPVHEVLRLEEPDPRLRDVEIALKCLSLETFGDKYDGNLKRFLDTAMALFTIQWDRDQAPIRDMLAAFNEATAKAIDFLGADRVGRKFNPENERWEGRFNKSLFEAEQYYFARTPDALIAESDPNLFIKKFEALCSADARFMSSIESTTKTPENYQVRFDAIRGLFNEVFGLEIQDAPVTVEGTHGGSAN